MIKKGKVCEAAQSVKEGIEPELNSITFPPNDPRVNIGRIKKQAQKERKRVKVESKYFNE